MKKREIISFGKGFILAFFLVLMINFVMAATNLKTIEVVTGDIKILLDNKLFSLENEEGKKLEPFVYENEIYLPFGAVARGLGLKVNYDSINNSLLLGRSKFDLDNAEVRKWLNEIKLMQGVFPSDSNHKSKSLKVMDNTGIFHNIYMSGFGSEITGFALNKNYKAFRTSIVWRSGFENYKRGFKLKVFLDDKEVWTSKIFESGSIQQNLSLDVSLKDKLSFTVYSQEKKNGKYDDSKWEIDTNDFRNKLMILVNPALY